ncbi:acetylglutamate kinase [Vibrio gazogenes]|uniref:Acetylglutamate kinase n=1 Tax=Vibrio gazogenes DSM 21264 = NBRC 103151 TaxID=1123492 RepID=A0A1M5BFN6_VIBGA|nr:acetylglutamate kinase [Vibrio gazogenes]USP13999.1 acetylglutamate kinase [Vibrio gazogenes]SHF41393.1 N-acetylglutamate kinase [Vibrio gazogenes DSM 21264] [Vibrio gazogenes DSM 21264 = NBRC 103151]SJN57742.1 Acetylglutamate kinase [Vibrio gazogenes]
MEQLSHPVVIKLGGAVLGSSETLAKLFETVAQYQQRRSIVIVHGGGYLVDELMSKLQFATVKKHGLRVTPYDQIPFITGALAGTANKMLQGEAIKSGLKAVGLCLGDAGLCQVEELDPALGAVGRPSAGDPTIVNAIMQAGGVPIISSIGLTVSGQMMNVNADDAAVAVAKTLHAELVLLSDVSGVLDENKQLIPQLDVHQANQLIADGVITDGMIVKVKAALEAADDLGRAITVAGWRTPELLAHLFSGDQHSVGTSFYPTTK